MTQLSEILPERDYALQMRFAKNDVAAFYQPGSNHEEVLAERRRWLVDDSQTCCALAPEGAPLMDETLEMAFALGTLPGEDAAASDQLEPVERCRYLGERWEPDFLLMRPDAEGTFRMVGGCLCFPSHWDLDDKMGKPMTAIHGPVPGLNEALGKQIDGFLYRIKPGTSWERFNWGLSRLPDRNLHPSRRLPRLDASVGIDEVWWRLEEQSLVALPKTGGILFGINIVVKPLAEIKADVSACRGLVRALDTMSERMASYKGIAPAKTRLLELLQ